MLNPENTRIAFVTIDSVSNVFTIPNAESEPIVHVICEENEGFIPVPAESLLLNLST